MSINTTSELTLVGTSQLVDDAVTAAKIAAGAVGTSEINATGIAANYVLSADGSNAAVWAAPATGTVTSVTGTAPIASSGGAAPVISIAAATTSVVGAVQLSDSTSTTSSVLAATPTAVKSAYDLANGAIPKTLTTTTGDIIYASAANTPARLGIGTASQVLSVVSGVPSWTTPAGGGGLTLIGTATPSGASSLSFTSIPGTYKHLQLMWREVFQSNDGETWSVRLNGDSSSKYDMICVRFNNTPLGATGSDLGAAQGPAAFIPRTPTSASVIYKTSTGVLDIYRYTETGRKQYEYWTQGYSANTDTVSKTIVGGVYGDGSTGAITSIDFVRSDVQTITGNFYLYGVS